MKNDINLLYKRKVKTYSNKNIVMLLLTILLIGVMVFFAIKLPSDSLQAAKIEAAKVDSELASSSVDKKELESKIEQQNKLDILLADLNALKESRADIIKYLEVIESQRPSNIYIRKINTSIQAINISGITDSDKAVAVFCLKLREQNIFKDVFLSTSTTDLENDGIITFGIIITLPSSLDSTTIIQGIQQTDDITANTAEQEEGSSK